jgi:hypothetical protein
VGMANELIKKSKHLPLLISTYSAEIYANALSIEKVFRDLKHFKGK